MCDDYTPGIVTLPQRMGWDRECRASDFYGNITPDLETLAEESGARDLPPLTCPMCGSHDLTEPHWNGYVADAIECRDCDARMGTEAATPGSEVYEFIRSHRAA